MASKNGGEPAAQREAGIIAAYLAGKKWTEIEDEFGVGRSTLSHVLRRSGVLPNRARRKLDQASADQALAGLYELIAHQDQRIVELEALNKRYEAKLHRAGLLDKPATKRVAHKPGRAV